MSQTFPAADDGHQIWHSPMSSASCQVQVVTQLGLFKENNLFDAIGEILRASVPF
jgi:hypothetical protein